MIYEDYTLIVKIPIYFGTEGSVHTTELWELDLSRHIEYIQNLYLCCPILPFDPAIANLKQVTALKQDRVYPLNQDCGWGSAARNVLPNLWLIWQATRDADIVHSGGAGWAFPPSYYLLLLKPFMKFKWIMNIESSFWMKPAMGRVTARQWLAHHLNGYLLRLCVRHADLRMFTQDWYRQFFLGEDRTATLIAPAVWVNDDDVLPDAQHAALLAMKSGPLRLLFPARLVADKGVETVLAAIPFLDGKLAGFPPLELDIIGEGPLADDCRRFVAGYTGTVRLRFLDAVPYGEAFFRLLRSYDAIIIANRQAEQPRIVFDAFSQGVTCIATQTTGIAEIVTDGQTGMLFPVNDAQALADRIVQALTDRPALAAMSTRALAYVRGWTHQNMHKTREAYLVKKLGLKQ